MVDFGSTFTKVTGVDLDDGCILGTAKSHTSIETDIMDGLFKAVADLEDRTGHLSWQRKLGCSSAAGGLTMVAVGLVPELTAKAAKTAALSAGAKILKTYSYKLNKDELLEIESLNPDILLLCGGTDGGNESVAVHNAQGISEGNGTYPVIYAGNKSALDKVKDIFKSSRKSLIVTGNVMPAMDKLATDEVKEVISDLFINRIIEAKGLKRAEAFLDNLLMPTPTAVMTSAELLARGTLTMKGFGDLMVVDMGGATTDVHSACDGYPGHGNTVLKGLKEPYMKRTVEGDLGARYSLRALIESVGAELICHQLGWTAQALEEALLMVEQMPDILSNEDMRLNQLDELSAAVAVSESVKRHCGTISSHYTPFGKMYEQAGKDLTKVAAIIGTGGPIIHNREPQNLLKNCLYSNDLPGSLRPKEPLYYMDSQYIMAAMGLLSTEYPETALKILKKEIQLLKQGDRQEMFL